MSKCPGVTTISDGAEWASSDVMRAVRGRQPFPTDVMQPVMPSYRVRRAAHYMTEMGYGVHQSRRRYEDLCRWQRAMPACLAETASRMCSCEPGGEVGLNISDCY